MGRGGYAHVKEKMIEKKEIEQDEEPTRGTLWLKGRVNKDGEYQDDKIRSVGDKLKETKDKIKEGTLHVDQGTDAMTLVLGKEKGGYARGVSPVEIHPINSSADEEGGTTVLGCDQNDASIRKEMQKRLRERLDQSERILQVKIHNPKKMCRYYHKLWHLKKTTIIAEGTVYKSDGKIMLHNKALPKDCYKVSIDKSLVDAAFIPDVGSNGCTTVLDAVGGFVAWPKNQVATPPSTIQMITVENKTAPKVPTNKNFYVSSDAMQTRKLIRRGVRRP
ncbi:hypothetical protein Tco_0954110 [Tanacetum coccineum]|uniref:DUF8039 domain-containing protein n=1 Tax=Tanacetum coccineum TaxID=301880 RepID=A0ABQ5E1T7_9ASTR